MQRNPSTSPDRSLRRKSSATSPDRSLRRNISRSPEDYAPPERLERPSNPPEPPLTLLHPTRSPTRTFYPTQGSSAEDTFVDDTQAGRFTAARKRVAGVNNVWIPFSGIVRDIQRRLPFYVSDWTDAWNYRVVPATWFIFFANVLPGLAFSLDLIEATGVYGVQEVLLASFMAAFVASVLGGQPLLISGVTGPITVFNKTIHEIFKGRDDFNLLHFMGWVYLWGAILHWITAGMNTVKFLKYVTRFSCDTFGFYVAAVYVQYGIQVVTRQFHQTSTASGILGILLAILTLVLPHYFNAFARSGLTNKHIRRFAADYGMPITIVAITGVAYWGRFNPFANEHDMTLPTTKGSFEPAGGREWLVRFWHLKGSYVGMAFPFGIVLWVLFYFDANVSALIAQDSEFPLRKPAAFHWDFFLLGVTTFIAGLLGVPAPNGLIPQAPLHTASLVVMGYPEHDEDIALSDVEEGYASGPRSRSPRAERSEALKAGRDTSPRSEKSRPARRTSTASSLRRRISSVSATAREAAERRRVLAGARREEREVPVSVVEQRVSNLAQGCLCLVLMTKPFEHVLGLIPKGVMAGLFWYMGTDALMSSGLTQQMLYLIRDPRARSPNDPLNHVRKSKIALYTFIELLGFGATFAVTQTIAAIGFPIIILLLVPVRYFIVPHLGFQKEELEILDGQVASPFTMESVDIK